MSLGIYLTESERCGTVYSLLKNKYRVQYLGKVDVLKSNLDRYEIIIFPGGRAHVMVALKSFRFRENIKNYVKKGGRYLGICGGTALAGFLGLGCSTNWLELAPYYFYYSLINSKSAMTIEWKENNLFNFGPQEISKIIWMAGPYIRPKDLKVEAVYCENKFLLNYKEKAAIVSGTIGQGKIILFGPHPEYPCPYPSGSRENQKLLLRAIEWLFR